jgi:hypothetical protein
METLLRFAGKTLLVLLFGVVKIVQAVLVTFLLSLWLLIIASPVVVGVAAFVYLYRSC